MQERSPTTFQNEVAGRFGVLPNFFCTAQSAPGLIEELWGFAKSAYLDSPLPSVFKERLFVHLSRFCEVRYCIVRHVGFLVGLGRPAGDPKAPVQTVDQVIALLRRPIPTADDLRKAFDRLNTNVATPLSELDAQRESDLFDSLTVLFVDPTRSQDARQAIIAAVGESTFELLTAYLAFIRTAHYWTETHPELVYEPDMVRLMEKHPELAKLMLDPSEGELVKAKQDVRQVTSQLHRAEQALNDSGMRLAGQAGAFRAAVSGAPLEVSLNELVKTAVKYSGGQAQCAFYLANAARTELRHIAGMPESFAEAVQGLQIGPESFACGLSNYSNSPVITRDVNDDSRWKDWRWLAKKYDYRGCWSFPIETRAGTVVGTFAMYHREPREPTLRDYELAQSFTQAAAIIISRQQEVLERRQAEERQRLLLGELNHRVKNTLASVQSIAQMTLRHTQEPGEFAKVFVGRVQSLARVHSILTDATWQGADLRSLIRDQLLSSVMEERQLAANGPDIHLPPQLALHLALILHELGTNASKYGALSVGSGAVALQWSVGNGKLKIRWKERGGPRVKAPSRRGFGSRLIEGTVANDGGQATAAFDEDGVTWEIELPLASEALLPVGENQIGERSASQGNSAKNASPLANYRLLIVEDEPLLAMDCANVVEGAGGVVAGITGSMDDALRDIETLDIDAALLDANLFGQPVDSLAAALRRRKVPFIFVSGYNKEALPKAFADTPILAKPYSADQLIEAVRGVCRTSA